MEPLEYCEQPLIVRLVGNTRRQRQFMHRPTTKLEKIRMVIFKQKQFLAPRDFCDYCGARVPPIIGETTCAKCDPEGVAENVLCNKGTDGL